MGTPGGGGNGPADRVGGATGGCRRGDSLPPAISPRTGRAHPGQPESRQRNGRAGGKPPARRWGYLGKALRVPLPWIARKWTDSLMWATSVSQEVSSSTFTWKLVLPRLR